MIMSARRNFATSFGRFAVCVVAAVALSLAFPKTNLVLFAPVGAAGLFWVWRSLSPRAALLQGFLCGIVFFTLMFSWFGETAGKLAGNLAFIIVLGPALLEAIAWAVWAAASAFAYRRAPRVLAPFAAALAFSVTEWVRSSGMLGGPFAQVGYVLADTPFAALAAFAGSGGAGLALLALSAYAVEAACVPAQRRPAAVAGAVIFTAMGLAWLAWPARHAPPPAVPVAAIQGNIKQDVKWTPNALGDSLRRYSALTAEASTSVPPPQIILWPETVVPIDLNRQPALQSALSNLAARAHATVVAGAVEIEGGKGYNALYFFGPGGGMPRIYRKRQLVPFAEYLPAANWFEWIPAAKEIGRWSGGGDDSVFAVGPFEAAPLICWESAFSDLMQQQLLRGANLLLISTDDAWFGETAGPFAHEQIARMRAIESGRWVVRAAATGISAIIDPAGRETAESAIDRVAIVRGNVGFPADTAFAHIGPRTLGVTWCVMYLGIIAAGMCRKQTAA